MDGRFFGIPRSSCQPAYYYPVTVHRQPTVSSPKVVSIPVHFVEPEPTRIRTRTRSRAESAAKIQAAFRGFVVRKYVSKLAAVRREVEEIERRVCEEETEELMRRDERERLKVNEALMSLLFRLDSVRGVDAGVKELRKKVIRKAIALQEKVDGITAAADLAGQKDAGTAEVELSMGGGIDSPVLPDQDEECADAEQIDEQVADLPSVAADVAAHIVEPVLNSHDQKKEGGDESEQEEEQIADALNQSKGCDDAEQRGDRDIDLPDQEDGRAEVKQIEDEVADGSSKRSDHLADNVNDASDLIMGMEPSLFKSPGESRSDPSLNPESFLEEVDENAPMKEDDEAEHPKSFEEKEEEEAGEENDRKVNNRSEEVLGRMMEDNKKMMDMMMQLFERNERQTQLLSLLSQRVERLEKVFLCEKLRRKKKRQSTEEDRLPNSNKCGKKL